MTFRVEQLELNKSYAFHITAAYGGISCAGELALSPDKIILTVKGEQSSDRRSSINWENLDRLVCTQLNSTFLLLDLRITSARANTLEHQPPRSYFEHVFEVGYVIYSPAYFRESNGFAGISIFSKTIEKWLGDTLKQDEIIQHYGNRENFFNNDELLTEFSCNIGKIGTLGVAYNPSIFYSSSEFKAGLTFPPSLFLVSLNKLSAANLIALLNDLIVLFTFLTGDEIEIEKVQVQRFEAISNNSISIYFPHSYPKRSSHAITLFPFGHNVRYNTLGLPELPMSTFERFFCQEEKHKLFFAQYIRYRRMSNVEERFLGYFRLLEALTAKKKLYLDEKKLSELCTRAKPFLVKTFGDAKSVSSFLNNLPRFNSSKYNTEKCLRDFFDTFPQTETKNWIYDKTTLGLVCKLRNDLSHANPHNFDSNSIEGFTKLVEVILVLALLRQLDIPMLSAINVISRVTGYRRILKTDQ